MATQLKKENRASAGFARRYKVMLRKGTSVAIRIGGMETDLRQLAFDSISPLAIITVGVNAEALVMQITGIKRSIKAGEFATAMNVLTGWPCRKKSDLPD